MGERLLVRAQRMAPAVLGAGDSYGQQNDVLEMTVPHDQAEGATHRCASPAHDLGRCPPAGGRPPGPGASCAGTLAGHRPAPRSCLLGHHQSAEPVGQPAAKSLQVASLAGCADGRRQGQRREVSAKGARAMHPASDAPRHEQHEAPAAHLCWCPTAHGSPRMLERAGMQPQTRGPMAAGGGVLPYRDVGLQAGYLRWLRMYPNMRMMSHTQSVT